MSEADGWRIVGIVLMSAYVPATVLSAVLFCVRRKRFPIAGRNPHYSVGALVVSLPSVCVYGYCMIMGWWTVSCFTIFTLSVGLVATMTVSQLRRVMLLHQFMLTDLILSAEAKRQEVKQLRQQQQPNVTHIDVAPADEKSAFAFFDEARYRMLQWRLTNIPRIYFFWHLGLFVVFVAITAPFADIPNSCGPNNYTYWVFCIIFLSMYSFLFGVVPRAFLEKRLNKFGHENLGVRKELKVQSIVLFALLIILFPIVFGGTQQSVWNSFSLACLIGCACSSMIITFVYPLHLSYRYQRLDSQAQQMIHKMKLAELLAIPVAFKAFLAFCASEFASENVLFYHRVKEFQDSCATFAFVNPGQKTASTLLPPPPLLSARHNAAKPSPSTTEAQSANAKQIVTESLRSRMGTMLAPPSAAATAASAADGATAGSGSTERSGTVVALLTLDDLFAEARSIWALYLSPDAPNEINVSGTLRMQTTEALDKLCADFAESKEKEANKDKDKDAKSKSISPQMASTSTSDGVSDLAATAKLSDVSRENVPGTAAADERRQSGNSFTVKQMNLAVKPQRQSLSVKSRPVGAGAPIAMPLSPIAEVTSLRISVSTEPAQTTTQDSKEGKQSLIYRLEHVFDIVQTDILRLLEANYEARFRQKWKSHSTSGQNGHPSKASKNTMLSGLASQFSAGDFSQASALPVLRVDSIAMPQGPQSPSANPLRTSTVKPAFSTTSNAYALGLNSPSRASVVKAARTQTALPFSDAAQQQQQQQPTQPARGAMKVTVRTSPSESPKAATSPSATNTHAAAPISPIASSAVNPPPLARKKSDDID